MRQERTAARWAGLAALLIGAFVLFAINGDFRLGIHPDEVVWTQDVLSSHFDFSQPLLLREVTRFVVWCVRIDDPQRAAEIGRLLCAAVAAVGIVGLYRLVEGRAGGGPAALAAVAATMTPLVAVHAHYFKDDAPLFACCAWAVVALRRLWTDSSITRVTALGLYLGLAVASKEPGAFLLPTFILAALFHGEGCGGRLLALIGAGAVAAVVAVVINFPMLLDPTRAWSEFGIETGGIFHAHWDGVHYGAGFHLTHSLWRGLGPGFLAVATAGLVLVFGRRTLTDPIDRAMLIYAVAYYAIIELAPMKPWPDADRYALPLVVPLTYFFGIALGDAARWLRERQPHVAGRAVAALYTVAVIGVAAEATTTFRLVAGLADDTRYRADKILTGREAQILTETYVTSFGGGKVQSLATVDLSNLDPTVHHLAASSFLYGRYAYGAAIGGAENTQAAEIWARYQEIFRHPYCEIRSQFMSYGFSNPTIRIVDIKAQAAPLAAAQSAPACGVH